MHVLLWVVRVLSLGKLTYLNLPGRCRVLHCVLHIALSHNKTDLAISNAIVKTGLGLGGGILASAILFRRRSCPSFSGAAAVIRTNGAMFNEVAQADGV